MITNITEINTEELKEDLIALYELYLKQGNTNFVRTKADKIYTDCKNAINILDEELTNAIGPLDGIAWPEIITKTKRPALTKERINEILLSLKKS